MAGSIRASLRVVQGLARISTGTLVDAARGTITRAICDERLRWWSDDVVAGLDIKLKVEGREQLDRDERYVVMSNHESHFDIPILFKTVSPSLRMVTKTELFRIPIWGPAMREAGFIEIDRANRERAIESLKIAREKLASGIHVWIAPEGTRSRTGEMLPFKKGGFMLALDAGARILPVGISGTREVLPPDHSRTFRGKKVGVVIGDPIDVEGKDRDALMAETRVILDQLRARAEVLRHSAV
jgi:1-acyl-sn-glycerol-3-phosphate acyltransferase